MSECAAKVDDCRVCPWWMAYTFDNPVRKLFFNPAKLFGKYLSKGMTAVDIGCGMGFNSIGMARLVQDKGRVIAIDLQQKMLDILMKRARRKKVSHIINTHKCSESSLGIKLTADLAVTFWMLHETPEPKALLSEIHKMLKPGGHYFLAEPKMHVNEKEYKDACEYASSLGLELIDEPKVSMSKAAVFRKK